MMAGHDYYWDAPDQRFRCKRHGCHVALRPEYLAKDPRPLTEDRCVKNYEGYGCLPPPPELPERLTMFTVRDPVIDHMRQYFLAIEENRHAINQIITVLQYLMSAKEK